MQCAMTEISRECSCTGFKADCLERSIYVSSFTYCWTVIRPKCMRGQQADSQLEQAENVCGACFLMSEGYVVYNVIGFHEHLRRLGKSIHMIHRRIQTVPLVRITTKDDTKVPRKYVSCHVRVRPGRRDHYRLQQSPEQ